jgi:hypothetical protein
MPPAPRPPARITTTLSATARCSVVLSLILKSSLVIASGEHACVLVLPANPTEVSFLQWLALKSDEAGDSEQSV